MNGITTTTITIAKPQKPVPKIQLFSDWLPSMGFVADALVRCLPEENGVSFALCEEIPKYSALIQETRELGGVLINIHLCRTRMKSNLTVSGLILEKTGLTCGDVMLIRYEHGFIRMRKLPADVKVVTARLVGQWLNELGFVANSVLTVASSPGLVTCKLEENEPARTHELVKYARKNKLTLLQVNAQKDNNDAPKFIIPSSRFEKAGLAPSDSFIATYDYGLIKLHAIDFELLGF